MPRAPGPVDLHVHTTASDGTVPPAEIARLAADAGLAAIAVTDHDTLGGIKDARAGGERHGVDVVAGVELSVHAPRGQLHLLGYFLDPEDARLVATLRELRDARATRAERIVDALNGLGVPVTMQDVRAAQGDGGADRALGRPHVARALVERGHVASVQDAFDRYLADGRPAFVEKRLLTEEEAVRLVADAGGASVLAHPFTLPDEDRRATVERLARLGLAGVEVTYPRHDAAMRATLLDWCRELDLVPTGGSDYHGANKPDVVLGSGIDGNVHVRADTLEALRERARGGP